MAPALAHVKKTHNAPTRVDNLKLNLMMTVSKVVEQLNNNFPHSLKKKDVQNPCEPKAYIFLTAYPRIAAPKPTCSLLANMCFLEICAQENAKSGQ